MNLPNKIFSDNTFRKVLIAGVIIVLGACIISQTLMQLGGGPRDEYMDLTDQLPENRDNSIDHTMIFEEGLPPFISSGGLFYPEKAVFDLGLGLGGLLFILISLEIFLRTNNELTEVSAPLWRKVANICQLASGVVIGVSLFMITHYPFNVNLIAHLAYAMNIFHSSIIWGAAYTLSRAPMDSELRTLKGFSVTKVRWSLTVGTLLSFLLMTTLVPLGYGGLGALAEWCLTFCAELNLLTFLPALASMRISTEENV